MPRPAKGPTFFPKGFLFDMDDTLVRSEDLHWRSVVEIVEEYGYRLPAEELHQRVGWNEEELWREMQERFGIRDSVEDLACRRTKKFQDVLQAEPLSVMPGAVEILSRLEEAELPRIIVSSSSRLQIKSMLESSGLRPWFEDWVSGHDDTPRGKPAPDPYLEGLRRLGLKAEECIAVEDSPPGCRSAFTAGLFTVAVPSVRNDSPELFECAQEILQSLHDLRRFLPEPIPSQNSKLQE